MGGRPGVEWIDPVLSIRRRRDGSQAVFPHFVLDRAKLRSKSKNTPFDGARMQGRVLATWVDGAIVYRRE